MNPESKSSGEVQSISSVCPCFLFCVSLVVCEDADKLMHLDVL